MAVQKTKELSYGLTGNYWVAETHTNKKDETTNIIMLLFLDEQTRLNGHTFIFRENLGFMQGTYLNAADVYAWVKRSIPDDDEQETNWFYDSIDC